MSPSPSPAPVPHGSNDRPSARSIREAESAIDLRGSLYLGAPAHAAMGFLQLGCAWSSCGWVRLSMQPRCVLAGRADGAFHHAVNARIMDVPSTMVPCHALPSAQWSLQLCRKAPLPALCRAGLAANESATLRWKLPRCESWRALHCLLPPCIGVIQWRQRPQPPVRHPV
eukprot:2126924-Prymnesium_polylepis.2